MYHLHPTLAADTIYLGHLTLCDVLLMNDSHYPWLILVPRRADIREIYELSEHDQQQLLQESSFVAKTMAAFSQADKINMAALGNMVPQLHLHIIARHTTDAAWPQPVWGKVPVKPYTEQQQQALTIHLSHLLQTNSTS